MTTHTPHRITTWQWTRARIAVLLHLEPDHHGATTEWAEQLRTIPAARLDRTPAAALTAAPHWEACDELGPWNPSQHQPADTPIYAACVNTVNTGATP